MWYICDVLYVRVNWFVVRACAVLRMYINVYNSDVFSVVNMYLDHLKFSIVCINSRRYVCCSECYVVSNERDEPIPRLVRHIGAHDSKVIYFGSFCFMGEIGFLNYDICMRVVNTQFKLLEFVFNTVYDDLQSSSSSCHQTSVFHLSMHFFAVSLSLLRSSKEQGCERRVHCIMTMTMNDNEITLF